MLLIDIGCSLSRYTIIAFLFHCILGSTMNYDKLIEEIFELIDKLFPEEAQPISFQG